MVPSLPLLPPRLLLPLLLQLTVLHAPTHVLAADNGLALTPPLGWRSFNAFWGIVDQLKMETIMDAMVNRSRTVGGKPMSLLDLGYRHVGLDGGWNYCFPNNKTFHLEDGTPVWCDWAKGRPCQGNVSFPDPQHMVIKAKALGLSPGWYMNNCGCNEHQFEGEMITTIMEGSVKALTDMGWEGLKLDSCSQFNNLSWWYELINQTSKVPVLLENCHQGGFDPGLKQWQGYVRNTSTGSYEHRLGFFAAGHDLIKPLANTTYATCKAACDNAACGGYCFESNEPEPTGTIALCYVKQNDTHFQAADLSSSNHCTGTTSPVSDCPYNLYRTSGDIGTYWDRMLSNLGSTVPFLGNYTSGKPAMSRPGAWSYPDMLEVGRLKNFSESRTHFGAWAISSAPLILSFDLRLDSVMNAMWPIISNRDILSVNQNTAAGWPGTRLSYTGAANGNVGNSSQTWVKPLGNQSFAVLFMSTGPLNSTFSLPFNKISSSFAAVRVDSGSNTAGEADHEALDAANGVNAEVCVRDLYSKVEYGPIDSTATNLEVELLPHDSAFYCVRPATLGDRRGCASLFGCPGYDA